MAQSVKSKIRAGSIFLFLMVVISGSFSIYYIVKFRNESKNVLKANYESLQYARQMQQALDSFKITTNASMAKFETALSLQENNITEPTESENTDILRADFEKLKKGDSSVVRKIRGRINIVLDLNMNAIRFKNEKVEKSSEEALTLLIIIVTCIFIVGLTFAFNFPSVLTRPIQKITEAIREIAKKNYSHRIHISNKDEFGDMANAFNEMAERLEYFESSNLNKIIFEKSRAEAVINSLKDASIGIDKNEVVLFANNQALQLLGVQAKDIIGLQVKQVSMYNDLFKYLVEEKGTAPFKIVVDDRENYFTKETIDIDQQDSGSKVIVLKNITSFKELDVAKTNFIATISHELKTPLASSDFSIKLLEDERIGSLSGEQKELIQNLKQDNQRMLRILSELLNMSQVEAGKIMMDLVDVSPYSIADIAIETSISIARESNISILKDYEEKLSHIKVDAEKTGWVLNNFLNNAIKYSPEGSTVTVTLRSKGSLVEFIVADNGPGIPAEYLPKVFDRFFKVPGSKAKGTGLGLAISREFIEAEAGNIWVNSELGAGSQFGFSFPSVII